MAVRLDVIQDASNRVGDLELGTLTGGVDNTHPLDIGRTEPDGHWTDAWLTIRGIERRVTGYIKPGEFETVAFPFLPEEGDTYELRRDQLHTREQMIAFANAAVRDVQLTAWVLLDSYLDALGTPVVADGTSAYMVPAEMDCIYSVLYQGALDQGDANWYPVSHNDWDILEPEMVTLLNQWYVPTGSRLRYLGTRRPREMTTDETTCEIEPSFAAVFAAKLMSLRMMKGSDGERMKTVYAAMKAEEDNLRRTMRLRQPNNVKRVRPTGTAATPGGVLVPVTMARAAMWYTGAEPPTALLGRPGDMYLQDDGTVWQFNFPAGWLPTGAELMGPPGDVDAATLEYDALDQPLDVVPVED